MAKIVLPRSPFPYAAGAVDATKPPEDSKPRRVGIKDRLELS